MKYALIIGNDRYTDQKLAKLKTPAADSQALARVLKDQNIGSFDEVISLINKTEVQVSRAISSLLTNKKPEDLVLVYFSGHGVLDDRGRLFLALKDTQTSLIKSTAISSSFIADEMDSCRSKRQILILDCCHSGAFERGVKAGEQKAITETTFEGSGFGRVVLTASDSTQYAFEGDQVIKQTELSLFTHFLLEGLQTGKADTNQDGYISLDEWYDYAYTQVLSTTPKQVPHKWSYHQQGDLIVARNPVWKKKSAELPVDLVKLLESPYSSAREIGVKELGELLRSEDSAVAELAREKLEKLKDDDSRTVSLAATTQLSGPEKILEAEDLARERAEREAAEQAQREKAAAEEAARRKAKQEADEKARREKAERRAAQIAALREISSKSFTSLKSGLPKAKPYLRVAGVFGVGAVLFSLGSWVILQAISHPGAPGTTTAPPAAEVTAIRTPPGTDISTQLPLIPTETAISFPVATPTKTLSVQTESAALPSLTVLGGADKIAFVANNEIWWINVDGTELKRLTSDGSPKSDLQFWGPELLLFISRSTIKYVNLSTGVVDILTRFPSDAWLHAFRLSQDGKQVMISLKNEIFVIPFDFEQIKNVGTRNDLLELDRCPDRITLSSFAVKEAFWSTDNQLVAWLLKGIQGQQVSILEIAMCNPKNPRSTFPNPHFDLGKEVTNLDWDGKNHFVFNTNERGGWEATGTWVKGWGKLIVYDWNEHKRYRVVLSKSEGSPPLECCFRDARLSPDGKYLFFAFQEYVANAPILLYYVPFEVDPATDIVRLPTELTPLPMEEVTFNQILKEEAPQAALRPAP